MTEVISRKAYSGYVAGENRFLFRGEIFSIPDRGSPLTATEDKTSLGKRLFEYLSSGGEWHKIDGQFTAVSITPRSMVAYRSAFSPHLLYFNSTALSDHLDALTTDGFTFSFDYLEKFVLDYPTLQYGYSKTPVEGIHRIDAGTTVEFKNGNDPLQTYVPFDAYEPVDSAKHSNREDSALAIKEKLSDVLKWHLAKNKPIYAELSGGLDSSFVCSVLPELTNSPIRAHMFSYRKHPSHALSENCAKKVAKEKGIDLAIFDSSDIPLPNLSTHVLPYVDEPSETYWLGAVFGPLLQRRIEDESLLFSGFGCDQLFMRGHEILRAVYRRRKFNALWPLIKDMSRAVERPTLNFLFQFALSMLPQKALAYLNDRTRNMRLNPLKIYEILPQVNRFSRVEWLIKSQRKNPAVWLCELEEEGEKLEQRFFKKNIPHSNPSYLLAPSLVIGPYLEPRGVQYVHPFCDQRLIDFAFRKVPWQYIHDYENPYKHLLRVAQKGIVPEDVRTRPHNDFSFDGYYYSLLKHNREFLYGLLSDAISEFSQWMDRKAALISFEKMMMGSYGNSEVKLSRLLGYLIWRRNFVSHLGLI